MVLPKKIVIASGNKGKINEFTELLKPLSVDVVAQSEYSVTEVEETGGTFVENAILKARHAAEITGLPTIADDSGIVVPALGGEPGIYSARYAGSDATNKKNIDKLLTNLKGEKDRSAYFICVLVFMRHPQDPTPIITQGIWNGNITKEPSGAEGFGYDPIFYVPSHNCTAAQLTKATKNSLSHRGKSMASLLKEMENTFA